MTEIQKLYNKIPGNTCKPGCFDCCINSIQMAEEERLRMGGYDWEGRCPHITEKGCSAYPNRAFICRLYGVSELFPCSGCVPERLLTADETRELVHLYLEACRKEREASGTEQKAPPESGTVPDSVCSCPGYAEPAADER